MASKKGPCFQLEVQLPPDMTKSHFSQLLEDAKRLLTPRGRGKIDNYVLLTRLIAGKEARPVLCPDTGRAACTPADVLARVTWSVLVTLNYHFDVKTVMNQAYTLVIITHRIRAYLCASRELSVICVYTGLMETCSCLGHSSWRFESYIQVNLSILCMSHMYVLSHKITLVYIRNDIQDVLFFAALNVSSKLRYGQALGCLVVVISSIKNK